MRSSLKSGVWAAAIVVSVSALTLGLLSPAGARPGLGGGGHPNISHFGGGGHSFAGGGGHPSFQPRPQPPHPPAPHPPPHPPKPHPGPKPPPPHPHPPKPPPHPPGPGPHPRPIPVPVPVPVPWVPDAYGWNDWAVDDAVDDLVYVVPADCKAVSVTGTRYEQCSGNRWYQIVMQGSQIAYIRVPDPR